jgi:hypothetical protein
MKTTVLQEIIQWTIENAFNVEGQDGNEYIAIDHEEMRAKFDEWLQKEKRQLIAFGYAQIEYIDVEIGDLIYRKLPEEVYNETYKNETK